jgi:hypothetical protein
MRYREDADFSRLDVCSRERTSIHGYCDGATAIDHEMLRECLLTLPRVRALLVDRVRHGVGSNGYTGVNEVRLRNGRIIREGLQTTLSELRLRKTSKSARARWAELCDCPAIFALSREVAKLGTSCGTFMVRRGAGLSMGQS